MKRTLYLGVLLVVLGVVAGPQAAASGSVGPGANLTLRGAYALGKALTFRELVCGSCPIQQRQFNRDSAKSLLASLGQALEGPEPEASANENVEALCGDSGENCALRVDLVNYYLKRRYRL